MQAHFGKAGAYYYWISRGIDEREVRANRIRKSVGAENTFSSDLTEFESTVVELQPLIDKVWRHCEDKGSRGRTVTLKMKFNDFEIITRSRSVPAAVLSRGDLERLAVALLHSEMPALKPVRLLGGALSSLEGDDKRPAPPALPSGAPTLFHKLSLAQVSIEFEGADVQCDAETEKNDTIE